MPVLFTDKDQKIKRNTTDSGELKQLCEEQCKSRLVITVILTAFKKIKYAYKTILL